MRKQGGAFSFLAGQGRGRPSPAGVFNAGPSMPINAPRPCRKPMCPAYASVLGYCDAHKDSRWRAREQHRESAHARGYDRHWSKARDGWLRKHQLCAECERKDLVVAASVVDHIVPHRGDKTLFWDSTNWQSLCKPCHDRKTASGR